eukprot:m.1006035 g.1006035  ORF g.1006035 m.1006035 type:complete len:990 (+) comp24053_c2_seq4:220-3189(+)
MAGNNQRRGSHTDPGSSHSGSIRRRSSVSSISSQGSSSASPTRVVWAAESVAGGRRDSRFDENLQAFVSCTDVVTDKEEEVVRVVPEHLYGKRHYDRPWSEDMSRYLRPDQIKMRSSVKKKKKQSDAGVNNTKVETKPRSSSLRRKSGNASAVVRNASAGVDKVDSARDTSTGPRRITQARLTALSQPKRVTTAVIPAGEKIADAAPAGGALGRKEGSGSTRRKKGTPQGKEWITGGTHRGKDPTAAPRQVSDAVDIPATRAWSQGLRSEGATSAKSGKGRPTADAFHVSRKAAGIPDMESLTPVDTLRQQPKPKSSRHVGRHGSQAPARPAVRDDRKPSTNRPKDFTVPIRASKMGIPSLDELIPVAQLKRGGSNRKKSKKSAGKDKRSADKGTHAGQSHDRHTDGLRNNTADPGPSPPPPRKSKRTLPQPKPSARAAHTHQRPGSTATSHHPPPATLHGERHVTVFPSKSLANPAVAVAVEGTGADVAPTSRHPQQTAETDDDAMVDFVTLVRAAYGQSFGFGAGALDDGRHIVTAVTPGGLADGKLLTGDEIVSVMGQFCTGMSHAEFVHLCCTAQYDLCLGVRIPDPEDEILNAATFTPSPPPARDTALTGATWHKIAETGIYYDRHSDSQADTDEDTNRIFADADRWEHPQTPHVNMDLPLFDVDSAAEVAPESTTSTTGLDPTRVATSTHSAVDDTRRTPSDNGGGADGDDAPCADTVAETVGRGTACTGAVDKPSPTASPAAHQNTAEEPVTNSSDSDTQAEVERFCANTAEPVGVSASQSSPQSASIARAQVVASSSGGQRQDRIGSSDSVPSVTSLDRSDPGLPAVAYLQRLQRAQQANQPPTTDAITGSTEVAWYDARIAASTQRDRAKSSGKSKRFWRRGSRKSYDLADARQSQRSPSPAAVDNATESWDKTSPTSRTKTPDANYNDKRNESRVLNATQTTEPNASSGSGEAGKKTLWKRLSLRRSKRSKSKDPTAAN